MGEYLGLIKKNLKTRQEYVKKLFKEETFCFRALDDTDAPFSLDIFFSGPSSWYGFFYFKSQIYKEIQFLKFAHDLNSLLEEIFQENGPLECEALGGAYKEKEFSRPLNLLYQKNDSLLPKIITEENGILLSVQIMDTLNPGIFMDQRENRKQLQAFLKQMHSSDASPERTRKKRLLNLFSYTGAFSLLAAKNGFESISIDISKNYLNWEKENHGLNETLNFSKRIPEGSEAYLERMVKREEKFEAIVIDPPTFSRHQKKVFQVQEDLPLLLQRAVQALTDQGVIFLSCNDSTWSEAEFHASLKIFAKNVDLKMQKGQTPEDFHSENYPLKSAFLLRNL